MYQPRFRRPLLAIALLAAFASQQGMAQGAGTPPPTQLSIPAQALAQSLNELARQTGLQLIVRPELVAGHTAPAIDGAMSTQQALDQLLQGSNLNYRIDSGAIIVSPSMTSQAATDPGAPATQLDAITVQASADASADGLAQAYAGGQVARGARIGILGTQDMMETPFSATSYTNQLIKDQQARSVADVLQNDPTVRTARGFGNYQEVYYIRGFLTASDDVAYNGLYGLLPRQFTATEMVERVEVLRGAAAFLYGATPSGWGIGGTINVMPKRAAAEPLTAITLGSGSGGPLYTSADISRRFGTEQQLGVRVNLARRHGDTALDGENAKLDLATIGLDWHNDRLRLSADLGIQNNRLRGMRPSISVDKVTAVPDTPDSHVNYAQDWVSSDERDVFGTLRGEYDLNDHLTVWAAAGMRHGNESNSLANIRLTDAQTGAANIYRFDNSRRDDVRTGEIGLRARATTGSVGHEIVLSAAHYDHKEKNAVAMDSRNLLATNIYNPVKWARPDFSSSAWIGGDLDAPRIFGRTRQTSFTLGDNMSLLDDRLRIMLGLRHQRMRYTAYSYEGLPDGPSYEDSHTSPAAGIVYLLNDNFSVYANYIESLARGETAPTTYDAQPVVNGGQRLPSFISRQYETGIKYDGENLGATLALFSTRKPRTYVNEALVFTQSGQDRHQGAELALFGEPMTGLRLLAGVTLLDAKQRRTGDAATDGKRVIGVPKQQANLGVEWDLPGVHGLTLSARAVATGSRYADSQNTMRVPGWVRYDLGARYTTDLPGDKLLTLRANIENVADKGYWASVGGYPGNGYLVLGAPRTFLLSATLEF